VEYACSVRDLTRNFGGLRALAGISFDIKPGEVFGLIGPNGSGKTTTLRIVSTLLRPSSGRVSVFGINVAEKPGDARRLISYLPEDAGAYKNLSGLDYLRFMATFYTQDNRDRDAMVEQGKELAGLSDRIRNRVKTYSKGMARKLLLARALMMKPRLAILDEPTSGLDVSNSMGIRNRVREFARQGN
jgi:ABC-2 type transport system ATP-binding protein